MACPKKKHNCIVSNKRHNTSCLLPLFLFLLVLSATAYPGMIKKVDQDPRPRLLRGKELAAMIHEIRQKDYQLVRMFASENTTVEQYRYCPYKIKSFLMTLCTSTVSYQTSENVNPGRMSVSLHIRGLAAEALALCMLEQPTFRDLALNTTFMSSDEDNGGEIRKTQEIQLVAKSMAEGLTTLLRDSLQHYQETFPKSGAAVLAGAQAAEAVWASSFFNPAHISNYLKHETISALSEWIVSASLPEAAANNVTIKYPFQPARTVMWAMAALSNLATYYCQNDLGYCIWNWQPLIDDANIKESVLTLDDDTVLAEPDLTAKVRKQMLANPKLLESIMAWICLGPIHQPASVNYGWPGDVQLYKDLTLNAASPQLQSPSIVPWSAAEWVKVMLVPGTSSDESRQRILQAASLHGIHECLCNMKWSPDHLEQSASITALNLWSPQDECPDIYQDCEDYDWTSLSEDTCQEYADERWCIENGSDIGVLLDGTRFMAKEACCICGGGIRTDQAVSEDEASDEL